MRKTAISPNNPFNSVFCLLLLLILSLQLNAQTKPVSTDSLTHVSRDSSISKSKKSSQEITDTIYYESEQIDYDSDIKILTLVGKSMMKYQKITLYADTIVYDINNSLFTASGIPMLIDGNDTTVGDQMVYNIKTRRGRVQYASTHLDDGYFNGRRIVKTPKDEVYVDAGDYTTCAVVDNPHFFFYGKNIKVVPKDKIVSKPVVLNIGNTPVATLPYFIFPIQKNRRSGLLTPSWGGHPTSGGYIDNIGYYYAPNDYIDFLARGKVSEFNDFVFEGASNYALKYRLNGGISARTAVSSDFGSSSSKEWALNYTHSQQLTPDGLTTLSGRGNLISQNNFYVDNSDDDDELIEQNLTANLSLSHRFEKINANGSVTWNRTNNLQSDDLSEDLPSVSFTLPSRPIIPLKDGVSSDSARWYNNINISYSALGNIKHTIIDSGETEAFHSGLNNKISVYAPQKIFKWITLTPSFNANLSTFDAYMDTVLLGIDTTYDTVSYILRSGATDSRYTSYTELKRDTLTRDQYGSPDSVSITKIKTTTKERRREKDDTLVNVAWWDASLSMSTNLYGIFPIRIFNFAGLRHTFTPSLSYTFKPKYDLDKMFYSIGIPYQQAQDQQQIVTLSLGNQFDGKIVKPAGETEKPSEVKFSLLSASISTSYNFEADSMKWSDLSLSASTGIKMIRLSYSSSFWLYDENSTLSAPIMKQMSLSLSTGSLGAKGKLWGGNILELDSLNKPFDKDRHELSGAQAWGFSFTPTYTFSMSRSTQTEMFVPDKRYSLSASANIKFTPNWSLNWSSNYNFTENQWVQNSININCDLECWDMRFQWRPERLNPGYYFIINIKKIPEIKWEQKNG